MRQLVRKYTAKSKRVVAAALLAFAVYLGYARLTTLVHADRCLDAGGRYDPAQDVCRHH